MTADYRRFLGVRTTEVAAYFGGDFVESVGGRRLRVSDRAALAPGWWTVEGSGRAAVVVGPAPAPDLAGLPAVRGHFVAPYLMSAGGRAERLELMGAEEPVGFAPVVGRRWPSGDVILDVVDFETGVEEQVRSAVEENRPIGTVKGVPASLRAAAGYAFVGRTAAAVGTRVAPVEVVAALARVAEAGPEAARDVVAGVVRARERARARARVRQPTGAHIATAEGDVSGARAEDALRAAGAQLLGLRRLDGGLLEVRFRFEGERFVAVVEAAGLGVVDAGICLEGQDRLLTLESLPAVIREAIATGSLFITRHA